MCGADPGEPVATAETEGSSPRVRSRLRRVVLKDSTPRIISACAEQTTLQTDAERPAGDHLRVCGADSFRDALKRSDPGSSPRVRSRRWSDRWPCGPRRIISACAEQTCWPVSSSHASKDHLRVCGADEPDNSPSVLVPGSSPRVRSRREDAPKLGLGQGIISACAEQTRMMKGRWARWQDHLRVCGADGRPSWAHPSTPGSSPRVRSRPLVAALDLHARGIISACAEQTSCPCAPSRREGDHLRVCGADHRLHVLRCQLQGSSPRVQSRHQTARRTQGPGGIISASAERTSRASAGTP